VQKGKVKNLFELRREFINFTNGWTPPYRFSVGCDVMAGMRDNGKFHTG
jgi:hypothetical protein